MSYPHEPMTTPSQQLDVLNQRIKHHQADFAACTETAWECRKWAMTFFNAAAIYEAAANDALAQLKTDLEHKWAKELAQ